jgi:hypothetical protein
MSVSDVAALKSTRAALEGNFNQWIWAIDASATATANPGIMPRKIFDMRNSITASARPIVHTHNAFARASHHQPR